MVSLNTQNLEWSFFLGFRLPLVSALSLASLIQKRPTFGHSLNRFCARTRMVETKRNDGRSRLRTKDALHIALAMEHTHDFQRRVRPVHDHVGIEGEEEDRV
jgi:hypothetical protein